MRGRKPKLTWQVQQQIVQHLKVGAYLETAAEAVGIHRTTLFRWIQKGEEAARGRYRDFYVAVAQAQSEFEIRNQVTILKAAQTEWRAAAWNLERRFPERYGAQFNAGMRMASEQLVEHLQAQLTPAQFAPVRRTLEGLPATPEPPLSPEQAEEQLSARMHEIIERRKNKPQGSGPTAGSESQ